MSDNMCLWWCADPVHELTHWWWQVTRLSTCSQTSVATDLVRSLRSHHCLLIIHFTSLKQLWLQMARCNWSSSWSWLSTDHHSSNGQTYTTILQVQHRLHIYPLGASYTSMTTIRRQTKLGDWKLLSFKIELLSGWDFRLYPSMCLHTHNPYQTCIIIVMTFT